MPRRRKLRKVVAPPNFKGYKPYGVSGVSNDYIELLYEEYEAIKLADYDIMDHKSASQLMGISLVVICTKPLRQIFLKQISKYL